MAIISRAGIAARHMTTVQRFAPQAKIVFDTVDLQYIREERQAQVNRDQSLISDIPFRKTAGVAAGHAGRSDARRQPG